MKICFDDAVIEKAGISPQEMFLALSVQFLDDDQSLQKMLYEMRDKGLLTIFGSKIRIGDQYKQLISQVILDSEKTDNKPSEIEKLAKDLIDLFPKGKKPGTNQSWRGNKTDICDRLRKFKKLYGDYSNENIIKATKKYVAEMKDNTLMRTLPYFIWKKDPNEGVLKSDLASILEDDDLDNISEGDFMSKMV